MKEIIFYFLMVCLATSAMSLTVSKSKALAGVREWFEARVPMVAALLSCPYCLSHWFAFVLVIACGLHDDNPLLSVPLFTFAAVAVASVTTGIIMKLMMIPEAETERLRDALRTAREALKELTNN